MNAHAAPTILILAAVLISAPSTQTKNTPEVEAPPAWAYPVNPPGAMAAADDGTLRRVPDSDTTYTLSQLHDFKHGARAGIGSALMRPVVENLTVDDMLALAAYAASLAP